MASDRLIIFATNNRTGTYGVEKVTDALFRVYQRDEDLLDYTADLTSWLGSDTISAVSYETKGATATSTTSFTAAGVVTFSLMGAGYADIKVTTTAGHVKRFRLTVEPRSESIAASVNDYET